MIAHTFVTAYRPQILFDIEMFNVQSVPRYRLAAGYKLQTCTADSKQTIQTNCQLQEERDSFSKHLIGGGFTDVWRHRHPDIVGYTYFSYKLKDRQDNKGWRLDYFLVWLQGCQPALDVLHSCALVYAEVFTYSCVCDSSMP